MIVTSEGTFTCKVCDFVTNETLDIYIHVDIHIVAIKKKTMIKDQSKTQGQLNLDEEIKSEVNKRKSYSPVWNFATKGLGFATCNFCKKKFATTSGNTTGALNRIKNKQSEEFEKFNITVQHEMNKNIQVHEL